MTIQIIDPWTSPIYDNETRKIPLVDAEDLVDKITVFQNHIQDFSVLPYKDLLG